MKNISEQFKKFKYLEIETTHETKSRKHCATTPGLQQVGRDLVSEQELFWAHNVI